MSAEPPPRAPPCRSVAPVRPTGLFWLWLRIGLTSFGGPAAQIGQMHREIVERRLLVTEADFLSALNFCMLLPGPEAQQLATYLGWRLGGLGGAVTAGVLFVAPGALLMFALAWVSAAFGDAPWLRAIFNGLLPVVVALVGHAIWRLGHRILATPGAWAIAGGALVGLAGLGIGYPFIVGAALLMGVFLPGLASRDPTPELVRDGDIPATWGAITLRALRLLPVFAGLWAAPVAATVLILGPRPFLDIATFFTEAALVTFGGAYAVLPFVAQGAVDHFGWLSRGEMVHGLALAETTPGPLILVTQYVGFFAGWNGAAASTQGAGGRLLAAGVAAALTTWVTFLPCFFFVLAGAPVVERLGGDLRARRAMGAVSAAVVGVMATLGLLVARVAFLPAAGPDMINLALAIGALCALLRWKVNTLWLIGAGTLLGLVRLGLGA